MNIMIQTFKSLLNIWVIKSEKIQEFRYLGFRYLWSQSLDMNSCADTARRIESEPQSLIKTV